MECKICNKPLKTGKKYCSINCSNYARRKTPILSYCELCGALTKRNRQFCSRKCSALALEYGYNNKGNISWNKGLTKETDKRIMKISKSLIGHKGAFLGKKRPEHSKMMKGRKFTQEHKDKIGIARAKFFVENPDKRPLALRSDIKKYMSYPEKIMYEFLTENNVEFVHQYNVGKFWVDFYLPETETALEVDGEYWHQDKEREIRRDAVLICHGLTPLHVPAKKVLKGEMFG